MRSNALEQPDGSPGQSRALAFNGVGEEQSARKLGEIGRRKAEPFSAACFATLHDLEVWEVVCPASGVVV